MRYIKYCIILILIASYSISKSQSNQPDTVLHFKGSNDIEFGIYNFRLNSFKLTDTIKHNIDNYIFKIDSFVKELRSKNKIIYFKTIISVTNCKKEILSNPKLGKLRAKAIRKYIKAHSNFKDFEFQYYKATEYENCQKGYVNIFEVLLKVKQLK